MKMLQRLFLAVVFLALGASHALAASSVWKAQKGATVVYLGGTVHLLREADYPLPAEFDRAFKAADTAVFETDIAALNDPTTQMQLLAQGAYADGSSLQSHLSPAVYQRLVKFCADTGFPLARFGQLKPALVMTTLTLLELKKNGVGANGVDDYYFGLAREQGKAIGRLETVAEQIGYLTTVADGVEDEFVSQSLSDLQTLREKFAELVAAWRTGDNARLEELLLTEIRQKQPQLYRRLIVDRNRNWLKIMAGYEKSGGTRFVLVGAAHLIGPDGLIAALEKNGYDIKQL